MIKRRFLKTLSVLFAVVIAGGISAHIGRAPLSLALDAGAVYDGYGMTDEYRSGRYYENLASLRLSGDQARDVVAVALSQLGYHEGDSEKDLSGEGTGGSRDFVEYNVLYGKLDNDQSNGLSYGYYWCASFVNWCFRQAGIPKEATAGAEVSCQRWINDCRGQGIFVSKGGYIPCEGDMVFFKDKGSSVESTHVGLVLYSDGHNVYTVEGNTSNGSEYSSNGEYVALKSHSLSSSYIVGYASPKYTENKSAYRVDRSGGFLSAGQYVSAQEITLYTDPSLSAEAAKAIPDHTVFEVVSVDGDVLKVSHNGTEGYAPSDNAVQITTSQEVYAVNYHDPDGRQLYMPQYCIKGEEKSLYSNTPSRDKSGFVGWRTSGSDKLLSPGDSLGNVNADVELVAVWDETYYVVTFKNADGTVIVQRHGYYGSEYELPEPPKAPEGFVFSGWGEGADGRIRGNASYTAEFISEDELASAGAQAEDPTGTTADASGCASSVGGGAVAVISAIIGLIFVVRKKK